MNRRSDAADRFAERRRQEDEAPRLRDVVPRLLACRVEIAECRAGSTTADVTHTRHIVVERAPALFVIPCGDASCRDGGHDVTSMLLRGLREENIEVRGEDSCFGRIGSADCGRVLRFAAFAQYAART